MDDEEQRMAMAVASWERAQPKIRDAFINEFLLATTFIPSVVANWAAAVISGASVADQPGPPTEELAAPATRAARRTPEARHAPRHTKTRPLKGLSAITYQIVKNSNEPILSNDLLHKLREQDDQEQSESRDNSLMAAMRRLKNAGHLHYENDRYSIPVRSRKSS